MFAIDEECLALLTNSVLVPIWLTAAAAAANPGVHDKNLGSEFSGFGRTVLRTWRRCYKNN